MISCSNALSTCSCYFNLDVWLNVDVVWRYLLFCGCSVDSTINTEIA